MTGIPTFFCGLPQVEASTPAETEYVGNNLELQALTDNLLAFVTTDTLEDTDRLLRLVREATIINRAKFLLWKRVWDFS